MTNDAAPRPSYRLPSHSTVLTLARGAVRDAWGLIAPVACAGCGAADRALCDDCAPAVVPRLRYAALTVGATPVPLVAALDYDGVGRAILLALKEHGRTDLAATLAPATRAAVGAAYSQAAAWSTAGISLRERPLLVSVPGSRAAFGRRGYHPTALLARRAQLRDTALITPARASAAQKTRSLDARHSEVAPVTLRRASALRARPVVLFDDVVTSGATLQAAARALREAGAEVVACAAVMATPRRDGRSSIRWEEFDA